MLDVTAVGSNLTPEQQEETLSDLAYLLDEFGSTRAVRVKLSEQQREIQRLGEGAFSTVAGSKRTKKTQLVSVEFFSSSSIPRPSRVFHTRDDSLRLSSSSHTTSYSPPAPAQVSSSSDT
ncbi:hypothetical protein GN958_ATG22414 [Phytophthora infestans]|uniref:Uncharacterized protein n=1 Tax=Phytophthora infestans TaxID=4787 RepID=A0A8S9THN1_PHYIN|nr:hypothetical protein GN958_ATG22414 [Phytophthora infestans]